MNTNQPPKFKISDRILLKLLLAERGMTLAKYSRYVKGVLGLQKAEYAYSVDIPSEKTHPETGEKLVAHDVVWSTEGYLIQTTKNGRVKDIQERPESVLHQVRNRPAKKPSPNKNRPPKREDYYKKTKNGKPVVTYRRRRVFNAAVED